MMSYKYLLKCIVVGESAVGKSCLLLQYTDKRFTSEHDLTVGIEFGSKMISIANNLVKLQIWDSAGSESFRSITRSYYRNTAIAIVVFDITHYSSFRAVSEWVKDVKEHGSPNLVIVLVGNKTDLEHRREVSHSEAEAFAKLHELMYIETSAKTSENVDMAFQLGAELVCNLIEDGIIDPLDERSGVRLGVNGDGKSDNRIRRAVNFQLTPSWSCCTKS